MALRAVSGLTRAQAAALLRPGYPAGRFIWMGDGLSSGPVNATADTARFYPFFVVETMVVKSIGIFTTVGSAGSGMKVGVWANDRTRAQPTGLPLFGTNTPFDTSDTGADTAVIADYVLPPGCYWGGSVMTGTAPQLVIIPTSGSTVPLIATTTASTFNNQWTVSQPYANDFMALNLTSASFTGVNAVVPAIRLGT